MLRTATKLWRPHGKVHAAPTRTYTLAVAHRMAPASSRRPAQLPLARRNVTSCASASGGGGDAVADTLLRTVAVNGECVVCVGVTTDLVNDALRRHGAAPTAAAALGRCLTGTLLMAAFRGEGEQVQVTFKGQGPLGTMTCIATHDGSVRGLVGNALAHLPLREDGTPNVGAAVGPGVLSVVRSQEKVLQPFTGTVEITSGEIAEDLAVYLRDSEQAQTALALGVALDQEGVCTAAGGWYIQVLPLVSDETLECLERNIAALPSTTDLLSQGVTPEQLTERLLEGVGCSPGAQQQTPQYGPCGLDVLRPRMLKAVAAIPPSEIEETIRDVGNIEVKCEFCQTQVHFSREDLAQLLV